MIKVGTRAVEGSQLKERVVFKSRILPGYKATRMYITAYKTDETIIRKYRDYAEYNQAIDAIYDRVQDFTEHGFTFK